MMMSQWTEYVFWGRLQEDRRTATACNASWSGDQYSYQASGEKRSVREWLSCGLLNLSKKEGLLCSLLVFVRTLDQCVAVICFVAT